MSQTATQPAKPVPKFIRGGMPTSFARERIDEAIELVQAGATDQELADHFSISIRSLYYWKRMHPEFLQAVRENKAIANTRVARTLYQKALGYSYTEQQAIKVKAGENVEDVEVVDVLKHVPPSDTAAIFWLKNRERENWSDRQDIDLNGSLQIEDSSTRDIALAMIGLLQRAGDDAEGLPVTIEHETAPMVQPTPTPAGGPQERRRRAFE